MRRFRTVIAVSCAAVALAMLGIGTATANAPAVHATATAIDLRGAPYWPGWDIATGVALQHNGHGGYVLDGWGGLHAFGGAPALKPSKYVPGSVVAHNLALAGDDAGGVVVNTHAKTYPFPLLTTTTYTTCDQTWRIGVPTRAIALDPTGVGTPPTLAYNLNGATLDAWGGIHAFCTTSEHLDTTGASYWRGWKIARGLALLPGGAGGFTLDGWGGVHAFGRAKIVRPPDSYWGPVAGRRAWDIARSVAIDGHGNGVVLDGWGGLHPFTYTTS